MNYIIFLFLTLKAIATTDLTLVPERNTIKQGELIQARVTISGLSGNLALNGLTVSDTIYFYKTSPLIKTAQSETFETDATIIFLKIPQANVITGTIQNQDIRVKWNNLKVEPVEAPESFIFGNFEIPKKLNFFWILITLSVATFSYLLIRKKIKQLKLKKLKLAEMMALKTQLVSATDYTNVLEIWKKKHLYLEKFPNLEEDFLNWEQTLFKYVFRPQLTDTEKEIVISSYSDFKRKIGNKISGV